MENAAESRWSPVVEPAVDAARQKDGLAGFAAEYRFDIRQIGSFLNASEHGEGAPGVIGVQHVAQVQRRDLLGAVAQHLAPGPVHEHELAVEGEELDQVGGVVDQVLQLRVGAGQGRGHAPFVGYVFANNGERRNAPARTVSVDDERVKLNVTHGSATRQQSNFFLLRKAAVG